MQIHWFTMNKKLFWIGNHILRGKLFLVSAFLLWWYSVVDSILNLNRGCAMDTVISIGWSAVNCLTWLVSSLSGRRVPVKEVVTTRHCLSLSSSLSSAFFSFYFVIRCTIAKFLYDVIMNKIQYICNTNLPWFLLLITVRVLFLLFILMAVQ